MKVKTLRAFSGVPQGTIGDAVKDDDLYKVTWELPDRHKPLVDWFNEDEFKEFLVTQ